MDHQRHAVYLGEPGDSCSSYQAVPWSTTDFCIRSILHKRPGSAVFDATELISKTPVALKRISKAYAIRNHIMKGVERELENHIHVKHTNIITLLCWFHDARGIYMVMERGEYSLSQLLRDKYSNSGVPIDMIGPIARQLFSGLEYLHSLHVIHRDIKPDNIYVLGTVLKIGDFGCSVHTVPDTFRQSVQGSVPYMSPELISGAGYSYPTDIWSGGITLYELSTGKLPFDGCTPQEIFRRILKESWDEQAIRRLSEGMWKVLSLCLNKSVGDRGRAGDILVALNLIRE